MPPTIAAAIFIIGILGLFMLDRDRDVTTSTGLWIPVLWLLINGSRPVSMWLQLAPQVDTGDPYLDGSPFDRNVYSLLLFAALIVLLRRWQQVATFVRANAPIILFFLFCLASIFWSDYTFVAFKRWTKAIGDVMMVMIVFTDINPEAALKRLLTRVAFVLLPLSVLFIKYYSQLGRTFNEWTWIYMYTGVSTTKNGLGTICLIYGLVPVWRFFVVYRDREDTHRIRKLVANTIVIMTVSWLFWTANSVTSVACFVMASGLIMVTNIRAFDRKPWVAHFIIAMMISLSLFALFFDSGGNLVESLGRDSTMTGRTGIWKAVLSVSGNPLVGTGFESFWLGERLLRVWDMTAKGIQEAHNGYLEVYLNLGWIGIGLLGVVIVTGYRNAMAKFRHDPDAGRIALAYFAVGVVYSLTEAGFRMMGPVWVAFLLAILAIPAAPVPESLPSFAMDFTHNFAGSKREVEYVASSRLRKEII
jgi:exopolysaccharide production protein ExoQ